MLSIGPTGHEEEVSGKKEGAIGSEMQFKIEIERPKP